MGSVVLFEDVHFHSVDLPHVLLGDHVLRSPDGVNRAVVHHDDVVGVLRCNVDVVADHYHDQPPLIGLLLQKADDIHLVSDVQIGGRFVQEENLRLLGQSAGQHHPLALTGGQFIERAHGQVLDIHHLEGSFHHDHVFMHGVPFPVGVASHQDGVHHAHGEAVAGCVRDVTDLLGQVLGLEGCHVLAVQEDRSPGRGQDSVDAVDQCGLPCAVGSDDRDELGVADFQIYVLQDDGFPVVPEVDRSEL